MCQARFYDQNNFDGAHYTYTGPQAKPYGMSDWINSLTTDSDGWLIIFNGPNFTGDWHKVSAPAPADESSPYHDLNHVSRGNDGDWKHQIESFVLYEDKKYWDDYAGGTPEVPVEQTAVLFNSGDSFSGNSFRQGAVHFVHDAVATLGWDVRALATGSVAWLAIFDQTDFGGNCRLVYPDQTCKSLGDWTRGYTGVWENMVLSWRQSDYLPQSWNLSLDLDSFKGGYPDHFDDSTGSGPAIGYQTQDARYRIYDPLLAYPSDTAVTASFTIDHLIDMASDDHVTFTMEFNEKGQLQQISGSWETGGDAYQIPDWLVSGVDAIAEIAGAVGALETLGISEAAANFVVGAFDTSCAVFNCLSSGIAKCSESDGGRFYLIPVVCHTVNRACAALTIEGAPVFGAVEGVTGMSFDHNAFATSLNNNSDTSVTSANNGGTYDWSQWSGDSGDLNKILDYTQSSYPFRTWWLETSSANPAAGLDLIVSCKVDYVRGTTDDHIIIVVGFLLSDSGPLTYFAQASVQFGGQEDYNFASTPVTSGDFGQEIHDQLHAVISGDDFGIIDDTTEGRNEIPDVAKANIDAIRAAVS